MPELQCVHDRSETQRRRLRHVRPTCRGVWLDRGELEKIIAGVQGEQAGVERAPTAEPRRQEYGERGERGEYGQDGRRRRRGGFDLFDIFD
ncbi:MAG: zf-TFIIB domain-containing protein [Hyphomonadaceae bacterium]